MIIKCCDLPLVGFALLVGCYQREVPEGYLAACDSTQDCEAGLICGNYGGGANDTDVTTSCNIPCERERDCPNERDRGLWNCFRGQCFEYFPR